MIERFVSGPIKCAVLDCENEARYVTERGELCCGLCPIKQGAYSIRIVDVGALVKWARDICDGHRKCGYVEIDCGDVDACLELIRPK